jgi:hypothetical protein
MEGNAEGAEGEEYAERGLDGGEWVNFNPKSKIQNPKSKILFKILD